MWGLCRSAPIALRVSFASKSNQPQGRAMNKNIAVVLLLALAAGCSTRPQDGADPRSMAGNEQDCTRPVDPYRHLMCGELTEAERRARIEEEERQARAKKEAEERAERERLERERAEQLAREEAAREAARKQREAEEERLAAERRRLEAEAARKAQEERERREKAEAEALARQRAEQEAREAAARECRRLEQERSEGRAVLENFVANYGKVAEFKGIAGQISAFLAKARKGKPCPPA
jgi:flagellar biosynthesis GTPase FlhF